MTMFSKHSDSSGIREFITVLAAVCALDLAADLAVEVFADFTDFVVVPVAVFADFAVFVDLVELAFSDFADLRGAASRGSLTRTVVVILYRNWGSKTGSEGADDGAGDGLIECDGTVDESKDGLVDGAAVG